MLELDKLVFSTETTQLTEVITQIGSIENALSKLQGTAKGAERGTSALSEEFKKGAGAVSEQVKVTVQSEKSLSAVERAIQKATESLKIFRGQTITVGNEQVNLGDIFTKSQANQLAYLKVIGATSDELKTLADVNSKLNAIIGINKFDDSTSGLLKLKKQLKETATVAELTAQGFNLTKKQIIDFTREVERTVQRLTGEGRESEIASSIEALKKGYIETSNALAVYNKQAEDSERIAKETAKAVVEQRKIEEKAAADYRKNFLKEAEQLEKQRIASEQAVVEKQRQIDALRLDEKIKSIREAERQEEQSRQKELAALRRDIEERSRLEMEAAKANRGGSLRTVGTAEERQQIELLKNQYLSLTESVADANQAARMKFSGIDDATIQSFIKSANANRQLTKELRERQLALNEVKRAEAQADAILEEVNQELNQNALASDRAGQAVAAYALNLKRAGIAADDAAARVDAYRTKVLATEKIEDRRRAERLTRAVGPQIGDVFVSLASGQNPLIVALQQGAQLNDIIALSGVRTQQLQSVMQNAAASMATSIAVTSKAIGGLLLGSLTAAGQGALRLADNLTGISRSMDFFRAKVVSVYGEASAAVAFFDKTIAGTSAVMRVFASAGVLALIAGLVSLAVAFKKVITENDALTRSLALTGASLGLSTGQAYEYARSLESAGISTGKTIAVITEMAKAGNFTASEIKAVTESAVALERVGGIAIEETVKQFAKIKEDPVKGLIELAKATGQVSPAAIKMASDLQFAGDKAGAIKVAMDAAAQGNKQAVEVILQDLSELGKAYIKAGEIAGKAFDFFKNLFRPDTNLEVIQKQIDRLQMQRDAYAESNQSAFKSEIDTLDAQIAVAKEGLRLEQRKVEARQAQNNLNQKAYEDQKEADRLRELNLDSVGKKLKEIEDLRKLINRTTNTDLKVQSEQRIKLLQKEIQEEKNRKNPVQKAVLDNNLQELQQQLQQRQSILKAAGEAELAISRAQQQAGIITEGQFQQKEIEILKKGFEDQVKEVQNSLPALQKAYKDRTDAIRKEAQEALSRGDTKAYANALTRLSNEERAYETLTGKITANTVALAYNTSAAIASSQAKVTGPIIEYSKNIEKQTQLLDLQNSLLGKTSEEQQLIVEQAKVWTDLSEKLRAIQASGLSDTEKSLSIETATVAAVKEHANVRERILLQMQNQQFAALEQLRIEGELLDYQLEVSGVASQRQQRLIELKKIELDYELEIARLKSLGSAATEEDFARAEEIRQRKIANLTKRINAETANDLKNKVADAISTALFEGGKQGRKKLRDIIVEELQKPIRLEIEAFVKGLINGTGSKASGQATSSGSSNSPSLDFSSIVGGFTKGASTLGSIAKEFGFDAIGDSLSSLSNSLSGMSSLLNAIPFVQVFTIAKAVSDGIKAFKQGRYFTALAGSVLGGFIDDFFGFGKKPDYRGGAFVYNPEDQINKGYNPGGKGQSRDFFRLTNQTFADFTKRGNEGLATASEQLAIGLGETFNGVLKTFGKDLQTVGVSFRSRGKNGKGNLVIGNEIAISNKEFKGTVEEAFSKFADAAAGAIVTSLIDAGLPTWAKDILEAVDPTKGAEALQTALSAINEIFTAVALFKTLPIKNFTSLTEDAFVELGKLTDGIQNLAGAVSSYYQNFYSEEERLKANTLNAGKAFKNLYDNLDAATSGQIKNQIKDISDAFLDLNGATTNRQEFRNLIESLDLTKAVDRELYVALLGLQQGFADVTTGVEQLRDVLQGFVDSSVDAILELRGLNRGASQSNANSALQVIQSTLTSLQQGLVPADSQAYQDAVRIANEAIQNASYSSALERDRVSLQLANKLEEISRLSSALQGQGANALVSGTALTPSQAGTVSSQLAAMPALSMQTPEQTSGMQRLDEVIAIKLDQVIEAITAAKADNSAENLAIATTTTKISKILERVNEDGQTLRVKVT